MRVIAGVLFAFGLSLLQAQPAPQPPVVSGTGTGAISGVVTDGTTKQPIDGAVVVLSTRGRGMSSALDLRVATDARGRFVFTRLPPSRAYYVLAVQFGYFDGGYGDVPASPTGRAIPLAEGEWFNEADVRLWRPAAISGRVIDEAGEPVVGSFIRVLPQVMVGGVARTAAGPIVRTDDRGMYRIGGLAAGKYVVSFPSVQAAVPAATPPHMLVGMPLERYADGVLGGWAPPLPQAVALDAETHAIIGAYFTPPRPRSGGAQVYPPLFYPNARTIGDAAPIAVGFGEERNGVDLQLQPVATARVTGTVIGPQGPVTGTLVRLVPRGSEDLGIGSEAATALVAANGTFTMPLVPYGDYVLTTGSSTVQYTYAPGGSNLQTDLPNPPGFTPGWGGAGGISGATPGVGYSYRNSSGDSSLSGYTTVSVSTPELSDVVLELKSGVAIRGRIEIESGTIQAPMGMSGGPGPPVRTTGQPMYAEPADGALQAGMLNGTLDRGSGAFEVSGLRRGLYRLRFPGAPMVKSIVWEGRDLTYEPFDTTQGRDFAGVVITVTDRIATIDGSVRTESGNRATDVAVLAFPTDPARWSRYGMSPPHLQSVSPDSRGNYRITLPGGDYFVLAVEATRAGDLYDPAFLAVASRRAATVRVGWGETRSQPVTVQVIR